jgi:hypothetical protein
MRMRSLPSVPVVSVGSDPSALTAGVGVAGQAPVAAVAADSTLKPETVGSA